MILCRKIKLFPHGDKEEVKRVYDFIRNGQYAQYQALNLGMGLLTSAYLCNNRDIKAEMFKNTQKQITNSNDIFKGIDFAKGVDTLSAVTQKIKQDFSAALKNGLAKGERCITNYKRTNPLITRGRDLKLYSEKETLDTINEDIFKHDFKLYIKWVNKIIFKVILGQPHKSKTIREELRRILIGDYKVAGSSIQIDGTKIILNLSIDMGEVNNELILDENTIVGVDLGIAIPAVCGLNNNIYERKFIGSMQDFFKVRIKIQAQLRQERKHLQHTSGGHGRKKKLKSLDRFTKKESNFTQSYNHFISKNIVSFALKNNAKYIHIEDLNKDGLSDSILRNWSYHQLQQFIEYKAKTYGIIVRKVNPYHTSQNCSECGHWEKGQRISQSEFKCKSCGFELNADLNASRNIAKSTDFR
jgi:IS605 OrfB family transposase